MTLLPPPPLPLPAASAVRTLAQGAFSTWRADCVEAFVQRGLLPLVDRYSDEELTALLAAAVGKTSKSKAALSPSSSSSSSSSSISSSSSSSSSSSPPSTAASSPSTGDGPDRSWLCLACDPRFEAAIYSGGNDGWNNLPLVSADCLITAGRDTMTLATVGPAVEQFNKVAQRMPHGSFQVLYR